MEKSVDVTALAEGVLRADRVALGRALTLIESRRPQDDEAAAALLDALAPHAGKSRRIGVTGTPGAGKSTFIDAYGHRLAERGEKIAVLAIDPSSTRSGGSLLGDKTRMARLAVHPNAFIRPSPTRGQLGGVAQHTHEALAVLEAAGYGTVFVETVGVGQSEIAVAQVVDCVLMLVVPGGGDEIQGIKRGILEHIDALIVHKSDLDDPRAREAVRAYRGALHLFAAREDGWTPRVLAASSLTGAGFEKLDALLADFFEPPERQQAITLRRATQRRHVLTETVRDVLMARFLAQSAAKGTDAVAQAAVDGTRSLRAAARAMTG